MNGITIPITDINGEYKQVKALGDLLYGADADGIEITSDALTPNPVSIAFNSIGFTQDDGVNPPVSNTWDNLNKKIADLSAITNNNGNASQLCIKDTMALVDTIPPTTPVRTAIYSVGDPAVVGDFFGLEYFGTSPYTITESGTTNGLLINPTTTFTKPMTLNNSNVGGQANPMLTLTNTNATGSVAMEVYKNKPTAGANGDVLFNQSVYGKDATAPTPLKQEYTRISHTIRDATGGGEDGSIEFSAFVNGAVATFLQINGNENEVNCLKPLDMAGNNIRTSTTNLTMTTIGSSGTGDLTLSAKNTATLTGLGVAITSSGSAGEKITLTAPATSIDLVPTTAIRTDSNITTLTTAGGSLINFAGGNPDERFNIDRNDITLHWNNASGEQADIVLENDVASLNSAINMNYQTTGGNMGTSIQNIPSIQRIQQTDGINNKSYESSPNKVLLIEGAGRQAKIENSVNSGENRMDLFFNQGAGIVAQSGIVNTAGSQLLYLTHTDNGTGKAVSVRQDTSGTGKVQYDNTIDTTAFEITSTNTNLTLQTSSTIGGQGDIIIAPSNSGANGQVVFTGAQLEDTTSTGFANKYLKIVLNGVSYKIALDNP
jgi:hypothetical protein